MRIVITDIFLNKLLNQVDYISDDKPKAAQKFKTNVFAQIRQITKMPYKNRRSLYHNDENIRDLIFKGYIIIYRIKPEVSEIEIFGFIKHTDYPY
jgi:plasmid stabilization system protein ParE